MTIRANVTQSEIAELQFTDRDKVSFRGREYHFVTTFFDCLEIRGIRDVNGRVITVSEMRNWGPVMIAADKGLMALAATNDKWKCIKFSIDQHPVIVTVVPDQVAPVSRSYDIEHYMHVADSIGGFDSFYLTDRLNTRSPALVRSDVNKLINQGRADVISVKIKIGTMTSYMPFVQVAEQVPRKAPKRNESVSSNELLGQFIAVGLDLIFSNKSKH